MTTEAESVARLAAEAAEPVFMAQEAGAVGHLIVPAGATAVEVDLERLLPGPRRATGYVTVDDAGSLITYTRRHTVGLAQSESETDRADNAETSTATLFADIAARTVTAVLNGHGPGEDDPGWGDHTATLQLRLSRPFKAWKDHDRQWLTQAAFAEHIEECVDDIVEPDAATMLEVAQTLQAHSNVEFRSQTLLANGQRQFRYAETVESKAGQQGELTIPSRFTLGLSPFDGQDDDGYAVAARFQFRLNAGDLKLRYLLTRVDDVLRAAFYDVVDAVETGTGLRAFHGHR